MARLVGGEEGRGVDIEAEQVADGVLILGPIEPSEGLGAAGVGMFGGPSIEWVGDRGEDRAELRFPGTLPIGRRHLPGGQLADDLLPGLRMAIEGLYLDRFEVKPGGLIGVIVAGEAVSPEEAVDGLALGVRRLGPHRS